MLVLKIGFGIKKKDYQLLTLGDVEENGEIEPEQQIYSQEEKDEPKDKYNAHMASLEQKNRPRLMSSFFSRLYNDQASPLHFGFLENMIEPMMNEIAFDGGEVYDRLIVKEEFPPENDIIQKLVNIVSACKEFIGLIP